MREYLNEKSERIDAVEAWLPYIEKFHWLKCVYDNVFNENAVNLTTEFLNNYDVVMINDVIEHIEKKAALALISRIRGRVIIVTPSVFFTQEFEGNPHEQHVSHWTGAEFGERVEVIYEEMGGLYIRLKPLP